MRYGNKKESKTKTRGTFLGEPRICLNGEMT